MIPHGPAAHRRSVAGRAAAVGRRRQPSGRAAGARRRRSRVTGPGGVRGGRARPPRQDVGAGRPRRRSWPDPSRAAAPDLADAGSARHRGTTAGPRPTTTDRPGPTPPRRNPAGRIDRPPDVATPVPADRTAIRAPPRPRRGQASTPPQASRIRSDRARRRRRAAGAKAARCPSRHGPTCSMPRPGRRSRAPRRGIARPLGPPRSARTPTTRRPRPAFEPSAPRAPATRLAAVAHRTRIGARPTDPLAGTHRGLAGRRDPTGHHDGRAARTARLARASR